MEKTRTTRKITEWTPYKARPAGRHRLRWMDQAEEDLKRMKITGWRVKAEDREEWSKIVEQTKTHPGCRVDRRRRMLGSVKISKSVVFSVVAMPFMGHVICRPQMFNKYLP